MLDTKVHQWWAHAVVCWYAFICVLPLGCVALLMVIKFNTYLIERVYQSQLGGIPIEMKLWWMNAQCGSASLNLSPSSLKRLIWIQIEWWWIKMCALLPKALCWMNEMGLWVDVVKSVEVSWMKANESQQIFQSDAGSVQQLVSIASISKYLYAGVLSILGTTGQLVQLNETVACQVHIRCPPECKGWQGQLYSVVTTILFALNWMSSCAITKVCSAWMSYQVTGWEKGWVCLLLDISVEQQELWPHHQSEYMHVQWRLETENKHEDWIVSRSLCRSWSRHDALEWMKTSCRLGRWLCFKVNSGSWSIWGVPLLPREEK